MPGSRVFLRGSKGATLFAAWAAILKGGGVVVAAMPTLRPGEIAAIRFGIAGYSAPDLILAGDAPEPAARQAATGQSPRLARR